MHAETTLSLESVLQATASDIEKINTLKPRPLIELRPEDIFTRAMKLTGDRLNSYHGKFRTEDLPQLAQLSVGAPVLIGHNKSERPVGRIFDGRLEDGFLVTPFYVPLGRSDARDLMTDIDTGVASEASISFVFTTPTCSACGKDMRTWACKHFPGRDGAFYYYDGITKVLEGSIVYRGAHPDTGFVRLMELDSDWQGLIDKGGFDHGRSLASLLNRLISARISDNRPRSAIIRAMASAAGISVSTVEQILDGSINCPPIRRLRGFARVLETTLQRLVSAAERDGRSYETRQTVGGTRRVIL